MRLRSVFVLALIAMSVLPGRAAQVDAPTADKRTRLQGSAYLGRNRNVVGATVLAEEMEDRSRLWLTSTNDKGIFRVDGLRDGAYRLRVERDGLETIVKEDVTVRFPFRPVVELLMTRSAGGAPAADPAGAASGEIDLHGEVLAVGDAAPLEDVRLRLVRVDGSVDPRTIRTAPDGSFAFDGLPAGDWSIEVHGVGMLPIRTRLGFGQDSRLTVALVRQPQGYEPSPLELMPSEEPLPPAVFSAGGDAAEGLRDQSVEARVLDPARTAK